jgi:C4-type Zn-finger protein
MLMASAVRLDQVDVIPCPRCGGSMKAVVTIQPVGHAPGLIAYECSRCGYVTSELVAPDAETSPSRH